MATQNNDNESDSNDDRDEEELLRNYFNLGYTYKEILEFLKTHHGIEISLSTLKRRVKSLGLKRKNVNYDFNELRNRIRDMLDGPANLLGYRSVWHSLQRNGYRVPRIAVAQVLRELDPEGVENRARHRLRRRVYQNIGPGYAWHCDGYDKLKPYGFPIHGCIDGYSRKVLWLYVTRSNNFPSNIAAYFLEAVELFGGCPVDLITDSGTENGIMAGIQAFFRDDPDSHRYVPSPRNQRIESWWSYLRKSHCSWWMNFFKDLCSQGIIDLENSVHTECLWFCFSSLLQSHLDNVKAHWNTHYIRSSRFDTVRGRPDSLFYLPAIHGGTPELLLSIPRNEIEYAKTHLVDYHGDSLYQEYFKYVVANINVQMPSNWREAVALFNRLIEISLSEI